MSLHADGALLGLLCLASALAGCVDAIVGGGGLIQVPALFGAFPGVPAAALFATNKAASIWGTAWAFAQYARRVRLLWSALLPAALAAAGGALAGAGAALRVSSTGVRMALPVLLLLLLAYTLWRKDLGRAADAQPADAAGVPSRTGISMLVGLVVGAYDGFFGPGTGSFFVFAGVRLLGLDFLHASAHAKLLNVATNVSALALFAQQGVVAWAVAAPMAVANVLGSTLGAQLAMRRGAGFVRWVFIAVVAALIVKTAGDAWRLI